MEKRIKKSIAKKEVEVDSSLDEALKKMMEEFDGEVRDKYAEGSFHGNSNLKTLLRVQSKEGGIQCLFVVSNTLALALSSV